MSASCTANSNVPSSLMRAMDGRIVRCGIISSCQSAVTSEIVNVPGDELISVDQCDDNNDDDDDDDDDDAVNAPDAESHGFSGCRSLIQQRRVGHVQSRQVGNHCLKVEQSFESTLRDLRLVRRVLRVPGIEIS